MAFAASRNQQISLDDSTPGMSGRTHIIGKRLDRSLSQAYLSQKKQRPFGCTPQ